MMLIGASLNEVLTSITRLIEAHSEGMLCGIFLLDEDGLHLRYGVAPNLPQAYQAARPMECASVPMSDRAAQPPSAASVRLRHPFSSELDQLQKRCSAEWAAGRLVNPHHVAGWQVLGAFCMYYREVRHPETHDIQLIDYASRIAGIAIDAIDRGRL